ncbi:hypothetical protein GCM10009789_07630 [Kribbella sancticallisti]|uniref:Uncharacterized protein n=1 Tax=Kribbella sancticallisti TaxID=460087 RepID=A0ABN2CFF6_9ACTN
MGFFDKFKRGAVPAADVQPVPGKAPGAEAVAELRDQIVLWVRPGFNDRDDVLQYARESCEDGAGQGR